MWEMEETIKKKNTEINLLKDMLSSKDKEFLESKSKMDSECNENMRRYKELEEFCQMQFGTTIPTSNFSYADFAANSVKHKHPRFVDSPQVDDDSYEH